MARRRGWCGAVVAVVVAVTGGLPAGCVIAQTVEERAVRDVAVGTWACTVTYDGAVEWNHAVGVSADGRLGIGTEADLTEAGTWTLDGLRVELRTWLTVAGSPVSYRLLYTGDADPPTKVRVLDELTGDTGRFDVDLDGERLIATQTLTDGDDEEHEKRIECAKTSSDDPSIRPRR